MKFLITMYLLSILIVVLEYVTTVNRVKKYVGKNLYKACTRRDTITVSFVIISLIELFCPIINTIVAFVLLTSEEQTYNDYIEELKEKCEEYGIDFNKSRLECKKDYLDSLEELEGIRKL